jgi:hypothetical protein
MSTGLCFCRAQKKKKEPFFRAVEKREETTLFRAIARGEQGSSLSFTRTLLFQMSYFSDQLREQLFPVHAVWMQLILYHFLDDQIQLHGFFLYHSHLLSFFF